MASAGFCPVPHAFRDQVWLGVGAAVGLALGYKLVTTRPKKVGLSGLHLKYWAGRGLMEVPRQMLAIAGIVPPSYLDGRYTTDEPKNGSRPFDEIKNTLSSNLGRMPVAKIQDQSIGQSVSINYFIAAELDMLGDTTIETAQILSIQEHLSEMKGMVRNLIEYGSAPSEELLDMLFTAGATDRAPLPADGSKRKERYYQWFLGRIEDTVGSNGFAVGSRLSLADVLLRNYLSETLESAQCAKEIPAYRREPLMSAARTKKLLAKYPKIQRILQNVDSQPGLKHWLSVRGLQSF